MESLVISTLGLLFGFYGSGEATMDRGFNGTK